MAQLVKEQIVYHHSAGWCGWRETSTESQLARDVISALGLSREDLRRELQLGVARVFLEDLKEKSVEKNRVTFLELDIDGFRCHYKHINRSELVEEGLSKELATDWDEVLATLGSEQDKSKGKGKGKEVASASRPKLQVSASSLQRRVSAQPIRRVTASRQVPAAEHHEHQRVQSQAGIIDGVFDLELDDSSYSPLPLPFSPWVNRPSLKPKMDFRRPGMEADPLPHLSTPLVQAGVRPRASAIGPSSETLPQREGSLNHPTPRRVARPAPASFISQVDRESPCGHKRLASISQGAHTSHDSFQMLHSLPREPRTGPLIGTSYLQPEPEPQPRRFKFIKIVVRAITGLKRWASGKARENETEPGWI